jgi:hypothetical protein
VALALHAAGALALDQPPGRRGYWAWLIPLASGSHSVGIVADAKLHPLATMNTFEKAMEWLKVHQPRLFDALDDKRDLLQDFAFLRRFSYGCKQLFSAERWALTGEAGLFLDPFYSPGTDFIAIANTYICELVGRDRAGRPLDAHAQVFDQIFHSFYESTLALYRDQYPIFGDPEVLPIKVIWDYTYYWGVLAQFFFQRRLADLSSLSALRGELAHCQALNLEVQALLRTWSASRPGTTVDNPAVMLDQADCRGSPSSTGASSTASATPPFASASASRRGRCARSPRRSPIAPKAASTRARCASCSCESAAFRRREGRDADVVRAGIDAGDRPEAVSSRATARRDRSGRHVADPLVAIDAGRAALEHRRVDGPRRFLLLREHLGGEQVAAATSARIVVRVFGPHQRGHALALCPELLFRGDRAAHLADDVLGAGDGLVPEELGIVLGDVAVVARGAHAGAGRAVGALPVLGGHPLHRVTRVPQNASVPVTWTMTWVPMMAMTPSTTPAPTSATTGQRALGLRKRRQVRARRPGADARFACGSPGIRLRAWRAAAAEC